MLVLVFVHDRTNDCLSEFRRVRVVHDGNHIRFSFRIDDQVFQDFLDSFFLVADWVDAFYQFNSTPNPRFN